MILRVIYAVIGILLIAPCFPTLKAAAKYYLYVGKNELKLRVFRVRQSSIPVIIVLSFGLFFLTRAILPESTATFQPKQVNEVSNAFRYYTQVAFEEELIFRLIPWFVIFLIRKATNRNIWAERINIFVAVWLAVVFGLIHANNFIQPDIWAYLRTSAQCLSAILYWYLLEKDGLLAPVVAHFLFNMIVWGITML